MIAANTNGNLVTVTVFGEFTLADFKEFETLVDGLVGSGERVNVLVDLREMAGFTVDVAWEDIRYTRAHAHDFGRIAVLTKSQWVAWSAWLSQVFVDGELQVFDDEVAAFDWLAEAG